MTRVINVRWGTIVSILVLTLTCLAGPAVAMMPSADGQCTALECQAAFRCPDTLPSSASTPVPVRPDFPAVLFAVREVPRPAVISALAESDAPTLAYRSSGRVASRSPPSLR